MAMGKKYLNKKLNTIDLAHSNNVIQVIFTVARAIGGTLAYF